VGAAAALPANAIVHHRAGENVLNLPVGNDQHEQRNKRAHS